MSWDARRNTESVGMLVKPCDSMILVDSGGVCPGRPPREKKYDAARRARPPRKKSMTQAAEPSNREKKYDTAPGRWLRERRAVSYLFSGRRSMTWPCHEIWNREKV